MHSGAAIAGRVALLISVLALSAAPAHAQAVGVRAQGMAGAFTGVADDASAVYWNPAGLASGAYFSGVVDFNALGTASDSPVHDDSSGTLVSVATPPLGFSYYRTRLDHLTPAGSAPARFILHHVGATVVQSIWGGLAAGATVQLVHGIVSGAGASTRFNLDAGVMESGSFGRVGLVVHNLFQPVFGAASAGSVRLDRQVRVGGSVNLSNATLIAADADLTRSTAPGIARRGAAVGVEQHLNAKATIRGGVQWSTVRLRGLEGAPEQLGPGLGLAPEGSFGGTYAVYGRTSLDAQATVGSKNGDRGWGIGLTMIF